MSMEIHVVLPPDAKIPSRREWQEHLATLQISLVLSPDFVPEHASGFCPMMIDAHKSGCEIDFNLETVESLIEADPDLSSSLTSGFVFSFRFGGDAKQGACAFGAAAGLIQGYEAVLYDTMDGTLSQDAKSAVENFNQLVAEANRT